MNFKIQKATLADSKQILEYILALAEEEEFPYQVSVTLENIEKNLLAINSNFHALIFQIDEKPCGFAVYYFTFATTTGKKGLHLDDFFIEKHHRSKGLGQKVMKHLSEEALRNDCERFEWWVLKTNINTIKFYNKIGGKSLDEMSIYRMTKKEMLEFIELNGG
jgi:GNAT superfamily N-acetyltransferase